MKPVLQAILLADHVYQDVSSGKKVIAGTFDRLFFKRNVVLKPRDIEGKPHISLPGGLQVGSPTCYINLTEVRGTQKLKLRYVELETDQILFQTDFSIQSDDPLRSLEFIIPLPPLPIIKAGVYALELLCDQETLGAHRVIVEELSDDRAAELTKD